MSKQLTGKIDPSRIRAMALPPLPDGVLEGFRALGDATSAVADALDEFGIPGCVAASTLRPTISGARLVGRALTVHNIVQSRDPMESARQRTNKMAEIEAHNLAEPGDVIVIQGVSGTSNMGGVGAQIGKRQGEVGAIVEGGVRDIGHSRSVGYPIWSTEVTPMSGKWRVETVEINAMVVICGIRVYPGDLVIADDTGVCFVPRADAQRVLAYAQKKAKSEEDSCARIEAGVSVPELAGAPAAGKK
jgi:regulator of RNase E activity RraA